jgi:hypothetical protein
MIALLSIFVKNLPSRWLLHYSSSDLSFVRIWSINALSSQQSCKATWLSAVLPLRYIRIDKKKANLLSLFPLFVIRRVIIREDPQGVSEYIADYIISTFFGEQ